VARLEAAGSDLTPGDGRDRRVERLVRTTAPWGVAVEIVLQLERVPIPFSSALVPGGFLTDGVGFGHAVFATTAFEESHTFLVDGLGFSQSDWLETELAPGIDLEVRFYHCNRRHHTIALARAPFDLPQRLHHIMFELNERDDVGAAFDRAWATDLAIPNGLGRHDNDGMFSFYLQSPAGFQIEVGHGARVIDDGWNDNRRYDQISAWGHQTLRSP
jgi:2,3-dihydroxybiphenyl 1,2-dioxygenase